MIDFEKQESQEPTQEEIQNYVDSVYNYATDLIVNKGLSYEDVKKSLINQGVDASGASTVVNNIKKQIDDAKKEGASSDIKWGLIWAIGGIALTVITGGQYIFWGAVVYGGYKLIKGISNS